VRSCILFTAELTDPQKGEIILPGREDPGLHQLAYSSMLRADVSARRELYRSVVLSGGSTCFDNLANRLHTELASLLPANMEVC
jgi:actin-related protein